MNRKEYNKKLLALRLRNIKCWNCGYEKVTRLFAANEWQPEEGGLCDVCANGPMQIGWVLTTPDD